MVMVILDIMVNMKKLYCNHFPSKGFKAVTVWPFLFIRSDNRDRFNEMDECHETTHALQQLECLWILFFAIYGLEWIFKLLFCRFDRDRAYMSISFEQEAYEHELEFGYNNVRRHFAWVRYLFTLTSK